MDCLLGEAGQELFWRYTCLDWWILSGKSTGEYQGGMNVASNVVGECLPTLGQLG